MMRAFRHRRGATLTEVLLYFGILGAVAILTIPLLFVSAENRMLQQTIALVELNGTQAMQTLTYHLRRAHRVLSPAPGETGSYLVLQMADVAESPLIIGVDDGRITVIRHAVREAITAAQVAVQDMEIRNTSISDARPGVTLSFRVSRTLRLEQPRTYERAFETAVTLAPADIPVLPPVGCADCRAPVCADASHIEWQVCTETSPGTAGCMNVATTLQCQ